MAKVYLPCVRFGDLMSLATSPFLNIEAVTKSIFVNTTYLVCEFMI